jgi:hypothetical protein
VISKLFFIYFEHSFPRMIGIREFGLHALIPRHLSIESGHLRRLQTAVRKLNQPTILNLRYLVQVYVAWDCFPLP